MNASTCLFMFATLLISGRILAREEVISTINTEEKKQEYKLVEHTTEQIESITNH